jgi:hypothetical protein
MGETSSAIFSDDRFYRYRLDRVVQSEGIVASVIMVNGSEADEQQNDQTIRKLFGFSKAFGWRRFIVGNKFGQAAKDIKALRGARDPIGPDNDAHLEQIIRDGDILVFGWGALAKLPDGLRKRWIDIVRIADRVGREPHCIGVNDDGHPKHPLMIGYDAPLIKWPVPWFANRHPSTSKGEG